MTGQPHAQQVIGYDAREWWLEFDQAWTTERKQTFLFRLDVRKPLSVDTRVWHSLFNPKDAFSRQRIGFATTWSDEADCVEATSRFFEGKPARPSKLIAITRAILEGRDEEDAIWQSRLPTRNPDVWNPSWTFLGYDVADQYLLSGLTNCGFLPGHEDVAAIRSDWGPRLNEWHLFVSLPEAAAFKQFSDARMAEDHAPFFVFGLWEIK